MSIKIDITNDLAKAAAEVDYLNHDIIPKAAKTAINRAVMSMRKESTKLIPKEIRLKPTNLKERYIKLRKAQGSVIAGLVGVISYLDEPTPLLEFVRGSKDPIKMKGIKIKDRKKLRIEIRPGKKFVLRRAFIQKVSSKQVFKRPKGGDNFKKQSAPSVGYIVMHRKLHELIAEEGQRSFQKNFRHELAFRLSQRK